VDTFTMAVGDKERAATGQTAVGNWWWYFSS